MSCDSHDCCDTAVSVDSMDEEATAAVAMSVVQAVVVVVDVVPAPTDGATRASASDVLDHPPHSPPDLQSLLGVFRI